MSAAGERVLDHGAQVRTGTPDGRPGAAVSEPSSARGDWIHGGTQAPRMNLLAPRLPSRRAQVAARWTVVLLVLACLDLLAALAAQGAHLWTAQLERQVVQWETRRAAAEAAAEPLVSAARETGALEQRLQMLQTMGQAPWQPAVILGEAAKVLPAGTTVSGLVIGDGGTVQLSGQAPSYAAVGTYAAALASRPFFRDVWIQQVTLVGAGGTGPVAFDIQVWLPQTGRAAQGRPKGQAGEGGLR